VFLVENIRDGMQLSYSYLLNLIIFSLLDQILIVPNLAIVNCSLMVNFRQFLIRLALRSMCARLNLLLYL